MLTMPVSIPSSSVNHASWRGLRAPGPKTLVHSLKDELLFVDFHDALEVYAIVEKLYQWLNVRDVRPLKTLIFTNEAFCVAQGW